MIHSLSAAGRLDRMPLEPAAANPPAAREPSQLEEKFQEFVGQTLFGQMLKSMRKTQHKPAYFHGGRAEEIFQQQLDQTIAEKMSRTTADKFSGPMLELFQLQRR